MWYIHWRLTSLGTILFFGRDESAMNLERVVQLM